MADFKLCISDPKTGKTYQKEVKDDQAQSFIGLNVGDAIKGDIFGAAGFELKITGGSDYCGFPMRHGIMGVRKKITIYGGVGFRGRGRTGKKMGGIKRRKTVCGHKIHERISQINLVVVKEGAIKLTELLGIEEKPKEGAKKAPKAKEEAQKEEKPKEAPTEEKAPGKK